MYFFLLFSLLFLVHSTYDSNCLETQIKFGIPFCIKCKPNYKTTTFNKCILCQQNDQALDCQSTSDQLNTKFSIGNFYSSSSYQYAPSYSYDDAIDYYSPRTDKVAEFMKKYKNQVNNFKKDQYCVSWSQTHQCIECQIAYIYNKQTGLCQLESQNSTEDKLESLKCLVFSDLANQCLECREKYHRNLEGTCVPGQQKSEDVFAGEQYFQEISKITDTETHIKNQNKKKAFRQIDISLPVEKSQNLKFKINNRNSKIYFMFNSQFLNQKTKKTNLNSKIKTSDSDDGNDDDGDDVDDVDDGKNQFNNPELKNCKIIKNKECTKCKQGYILNILRKLMNDHVCQEISHPIQLSKAIISIQQNNVLKEIIIQHLRKRQEPYNDPKCLQYNSETSKPEKCIRCLQRYYFSFTERKCLEVDRNCKKYNFSNGYCHYCHYGYIPVSGECKLINRENYMMSYHSEPYFQNYGSHY